MKIKCDYCDNYIEPTSEKCECCGAPNSQYKRTANSQPQTIEQLKDWYAAHNLPNENVTRFFIGKDYRGARAFGIYQDKNGDFVVYKNKSDGTRVERYRGDDETFAVNELYQRLRSEIAIQKSLNASESPVSYERNRVSVPTEKKEKDFMESLGKVMFTMLWIMMGLAILFPLVNEIKFNHKDGYYRYGSQYYYHYDHNFYYYDDVNDNWKTYYGEFAEDVDDYYISSSVPKYVEDFKDSATYERAYQEYLDRQSYDDDDWDSSSSWDSSDSWDSSSTDWSSDW